MTAKTQAKNVAKKAAQANPEIAAAKLAVVPVLAPTIHALIVSEHQATQAEGKAAQTVYGLFKSLILAVPLNDAVQMNLVKQDIITTYGDEQQDAAQLRVQLLNNARKVEFGGVKGKVQVKGRGRAVLLEVLDSVTSIRELKTKLVEAKPEGLKDNRGGSNKKPKEAKAEKASKTVTPATVMPADRKAAFAAACEVLAFVAKFLLPGTDAQLLGDIESVAEKLKQAA